MSAAVTIALVYGMYLLPGCDSQPRPARIVQDDKVYTSIVVEEPKPLNKGTWAVGVNPNLGLQGEVVYVLSHRSDWKVNDRLQFRGYDLVGTNDFGRYVRIAEDQ